MSKKKSILKLRKTKRKRRKEEDPQQTKIYQTLLAPSGHFIKDLVNQYATSGAYKRGEILRKEIQPMPIKRARKFVTEIYHGDVPVDHNDAKYLYHLLAYHIVLSAAKINKHLLDEQQLASMQKARSDLIEQGPDKKADLHTSIYGSRHEKHKSKKEKQMKDKEKKAAKKAKESKSEKKKEKKASKEKVKSKEKSNGSLRILGHTIDPAKTKFSLIKGAQKSKKFKKSGRYGIANKYLEGGAVTFNEAITKVKKGVNKELKPFAKKLKTDKQVFKLVRNTLRGLIRHKLVVAK